MSGVRIVLILTENWTRRPTPDVADLVQFAVEAERAGLYAVMVSEHVVLGPSSDEAGLPANPRDYALPGNVAEAYALVTSLVPRRRAAAAEAAAAEAAAAEAAAAVAWLLSDAASYVNGAVIRWTAAGSRWTRARCRSTRGWRSGPSWRREHGRSSAASARLQRWRPA